MLVKDFKLKGLVYDLRFKGGYLYWDNCGKIWTSILKKFPELIQSRVDTQRATFLYQQKSIQLEFNYEIIVCKQEFPENWDAFIGFSDVIPIIIEYLQIPLFTRLGNRATYYYPCESKEKAEEFLRKFKWLSISDRFIKSVMQEGKLKDEKISFSIEDEDMGYSFHLFSEHRFLSLSTNLPGVTIDSSKFPKDVFVVDIDIYTKKMVPLETLVHKELLLENERRTKKFLQELSGI